MAKEASILRQLAMVAFAMIFCAAIPIYNVNLVRMNRRGQRVLSATYDGFRDGEFVIRDPALWERGE